MWPVFKSCNKEKAVLQDGRTEEDGVLHQCGQTWHWRQALVSFINVAAVTLETGFGVLHQCGIYSSPWKPIRSAIDLFVLFRHYLTRELVMNSCVKGNSWIKTSARSHNHYICFIGLPAKLYRFLIKLKFHK